MIEKKINLKNELDTVNLGKQLAMLMTAPFTLHLVGDLGAGKTTLSRGIIQSFGHEGAVKSPTYTIVEPYELNQFVVYHFDLYRLSDPEELEFMGIRDYFNDNSICLVEWPHHGDGLLPSPDLILQLHYKNQSREIVISANSHKGEELLVKL